MLQILNVGVCAVFRVKACTLPSCQVGCHTDQEAQVQFSTFKWTANVWLLVNCNAQQASR